MRRLLAALIGMACWFAPSAAQACSWNPVISIGGPDEPGISAQEKAKREALQRAEVTKRYRSIERQWKDEARAGLEGGAPAYARALVDTIVPEPLYLRSRNDCGIDPDFVRDDDEYYVQGVSRVLANRSWLRPDSAGLDRPWSRQIKGCGAEMRGRFAAYLAVHSDPARLARVWAKVHRLGFDRFGFDEAGWEKRLPLFRHPQGAPQRLERDIFAGPYLPLQWGASSFERDLHSKMSASRLAQLKRFFAEDSSAREILATIERGYAELSDETQFYRGLCPETTAGLDPIIEEARLKVEERYKSRPPKTAN